MMIADLHCHSTVSDGWLTPAELVRRARANGVELLALTDHDEVGGLDEALAEAASGEGPRLIPGVEISVSLFDETVHIVGLGIDHRNPQLLAGLQQVRAGRDQRAADMAEQLAAVGIHGVLEGARRYARNPALLSRAHFARHLVATGLMPDVATVFHHYLVRGKPGFVEHRWAELEEALGWIHAAGGIAVIAHPARYRFSNAQMEAFFERFVAAGGQAVEVATAAHTHDEMLRIATLARRHKLYASCGSDFHGEQESRVDLGRCPPLPPDLTPVWQLLPQTNNH